MGKKKDLASDECHIIVKYLGNWCSKFDIAKKMGHDPQKHQEIG